ncbi:MAG: purine-nucleoside phosphorylase [Actinomycetota bacterium]|nr:purine-nucleoside phosphorylase [Actinomycetota bacterium]
MPTPHISAHAGDFSDICLLPGDPLRARYVAEQFLDDATLVTSVRNMEGYTGSYRDRRVSVMGTGMGMPSILVYATELIRQYGVTSLIRIGSCGGIQPGLSIRDIVIASGASTDSNANRLRFGGFDFAAIADFGLTRTLVEVAEEREAPVRVGNVLSSDQFYHPQSEIFEFARRMGLLAVEMEAAGLYAVAAEHGVRAAAILTVSDMMGSEEEMPAEDRQTSLDEMITIALEAAVRIDGPTSA